ncbi:MAG: prepilin-type N-terminal cleavage/methylation domain-containing protein [Candidatus Dojkabacteria bacterium]|nr:prepilin-type N-terminal cleavage/methylation domain-containing protein [Candidatus Dojkabacteria bacterium]
MSELLKKIKIIVNRSSKGFSLLEVVVTMGIFAILMAIVMSILVINLKVSMRVKARSYAREESAFALNLLKKDLRNAELIEYSSGAASGMVPGSGDIKVSVLDAGGGHTYTWYLDGSQIRRVETGTLDTTYLTPSDVEFDSAGFWIRVIDRSTLDTENYIVLIKMKVRAGGMPEGNWIYKEVAISTRNLNF